MRARYTAERQQPSFAAIAESDKTIGQEVNIATQSEISIGDLAKMIIRLVGSEAQIVTDEARVRPGKSEVERLFGSSKKIGELTDWKQQYTLEQGLRETIEWFKDKDNLRFYKPGIYNV